MYFVNFCTSCWIVSITFISYISVVQVVVSVSALMPPVIQHVSLPKYRFWIGGQEMRWDSTRESWLHLYVKLCGNFCDGNQMVFVRRYGRMNTIPVCPSLCYECDCDVTCPVYGTCCPQLDSSTPLRPDDVDIDESKPGVITFLGILSDIKLKDGNVFEEYDRGVEKFQGHFQCMRINSGSEATDHVFGIVTCPETEMNEKLRELCESDDPDLATRESLLPVSDVQNGMVYKNVYCLKCWQRKELRLDVSKRSVEDPTKETDLDGKLYQRWGLLLQCDVYQSFYKMTNTSQFLSAVMKSIRFKSELNPDCEVRYSFDDSKTPDTSKPKSCFPHPYSKTPHCNGSIYNNDVISNLCASTNKPAYSIMGGHNLFCELCNYNTVPCTPAISRSIVYISSPINFLLGDQSAVIRIDDDAVTTRLNVTYQCPRPLEWMDEEDRCRLPRCADGKVLDIPSGRCKTVISVISNLGYKLSIVLVPDQKIPRSYSFSIQDEVEHLFHQYMESGYLAVYMVVFGTDTSEDHDVIKCVKIQGNFVALKDVRRDEFEESFLKYNFKILLNPSDKNSTVTFTPGGMGVDHVGRMGIREHTLGNPEDQLHLPEARVDDDVPEKWPGEPMSLKALNLNHFVPLTVPRDPQQPITFKNVLYVQVGNPINSHPIWNMKNDFIDMTPTLLCPFVVFDIKETATINETKMIITFYYNGQEKTINTSTHDRNLTIEDRKLKICIETFREEFQKIIISQQVSNETNIEITWMSAIKRHLTICCLMLSVICLLVTSVTYCIFSQLRTLPGLNTLSLCLTLASAHVTLILVVELVGYVDGYLCIALGILLHYTWLCSFCWMGVCCVHMYLVFRGTYTRHDSSRNPTEEHTQYKIGAFGTSAVVVSVHICCCEIVSEGETTGYSDKVCFFDTEWSILTVLLSFVIPLVILLIVNAVLFAMTVREMAVVRRMQAIRRDKSRDELLTYVKLSTITGLQWLVSLLIVKIDDDVSDMAVAILVGLEGVFIFVSFTLNKNTRSLYRNLCGGDGVSLVGSSSSNRKTSHSSNTQTTDI